MIDDINAEPDYGDEPPFACSSSMALGDQRLACGGTPGHAGKHTFQIAWADHVAGAPLLSDYLRERGRPGVADAIERAEPAAQPQPAPELAAAMAETRALRELVIDMLAAFTVTGSGHSARVGQVQIAKWRERAGLPK